MVGFRDHSSWPSVAGDAGEAGLVTECAYYFGTFLPGTTHFTRIVMPT